MKNKAIIYLFIVFLSVSCKAQQYPLNTDYEIIPDNSYIKDLNNDYNKYIGTWKTILGNKEVYLYISKQTNRPIDRITKKFFRDVLLIKYKIIVNNQIIENTLNNIKDNMISTNIQNDGTVAFTYTGSKCKVGWGSVSIKSLDSTHFYWNYYPDSTVITNINCPDYPAGGIDINLPDEPENIVFTKQ